MPTRPNILLIMCDQLNASALDCYGGAAPSPNISRLASEGLVLTDTTCPTPYCSPSRASMVTGLYPHTHGIIHNVMGTDYPTVGGPATEEGIRADEPITDKLLSDAGYQTYHYGKWHLSGDELPYFPDRYREHIEYTKEMTDVFDEVRKRPRDEWTDWYGWPLPVTRTDTYRRAIENAADRWGQGKTFEFAVKMGRLDLPLEQNYDVRVADKSIECLGNLGDDRPFLLTASFNYPHDPNVVPSPYYDAFSPDAMALPANFDTRESRFEKELSRRLVSELGMDATREFLRIYYASVQLIDDQVGRILDALDATGRTNDTIVIFTSDHGDMAGGHGMIWKSTSAFYEEVVRVPFIIRYPGRIARGRSDLPASLTDLSPTLLDLAGRPVPGHMEGTDLAPFLLGERDPAEAPPYTFSERLRPNAGSTRTCPSEMTGQFMVRGKGWKYVQYADGETFLYHLEDDPGETRNLIGKPRYGPKAKELMLQLVKWWNDTGFTLKKG